MSFEIKLCVEETCDSITVTDKTGYFSTENPWGYNTPDPTVPTLVADVFGYSQYQLQVFYAKLGGYDETQPDFTANLLTTPYTVDPDTGYVTWMFTYEDLGVSSIRSGTWLFRINPALYDGNDYANDWQTAFTEDIQYKIDQRALKADFDCGCSEGCESIWDLNAKLELAKRMACRCQNPEKFQSMIDSLYNSYQRCC